MAFRVDPNAWFGTMKDFIWKYIKMGFVFYMNIPDIYKAIVMIIFTIITICLVIVAWKERGEWLRVEY